MAKQKRKLTTKQKAAKKKRRLEYETIFINGKQKSVRREPTIDGMPVDEFIMNNADPIWLMQNGMYEELFQLEQEWDEAAPEGSQPKPVRMAVKAENYDDDLPF